MGRDKALLEIDGVPLARRVADALAAAGCDPVVAVGGDAAGLTAAGLAVVADRHPGEGPLGAIITALRALGPTAGPAAVDVVAVLGCDLPDADPRAIGAVLAPFLAPGGDALDVVVPRGPERRHLHHAAWRVGSLEVLEAAFAEGERAPRRVLDRLRVHELPVDGDVDPRWLADLDEPADLAARTARGGQDHLPDGPLGGPGSPGR